MLKPREMKWLVLLVLSGLATASDLELGDRIVATEEECGRIMKLNDNWRTSNFHEQAVQYVDLYFICQESLNEDKYAYIDKNKVDLSWYPGPNDKFPVFTSGGEKYVTKPPQRKPKDEEMMKKKLTEYLTHAGGKMNPIYRLMTIQSDMSQVIIDKQVECEFLAVQILRHPEDKDSEAKHNDCVTKLNCAKEKFMEQHKFTRKQYPDFFPIMYKRRGTMIKTPPQLEKSVCETPDSLDGNKRELEKWLSGVEYVGEKLADIGIAGTDFVDKLVKKGMGGGDKLLTKTELDDILKDATSVTIKDDSGEDDENTYNVYGDMMLSKLGEMEAKGVDIAHAQLEKARPAIEKVENIATATSAQLKKLEELKIKPAIKKTVDGLSQAESNIKEKSTSTYENVKGALASAGNAAMVARSKAKEEGSILMSKLQPKSHQGKKDEEENVDEAIHDHKEDREIANGNSHGWLGNLIDHMIHPEYLPDHYGDTQAPSLLKILKEMGGGDADGKDKMSDSELQKLLKSLKHSTKKKAEDLHLSKEQIKQSAELVKGVMHTLLYAGAHGYGPAHDMSPQEINHATSQVDKLVNYATAQIIQEDDESREDSEDNAEHKVYKVKKENVSPNSSKHQESPTTELHQVNEKDTITPTAGQEPRKDDDVIVLDDSESNEGSVNDENQDSTQVQKKNVPDIK